MKASRKFSQLLDSNVADRQAYLNAWLKLNGVAKGDLARSIGVSPSMLSRIIQGARAPARRIRQLVDLGVPEELLPAPKTRKHAKASKSGRARLGSPSPSVRKSGDGDDSVRDKTRPEPTAKADTA